MTTQNKKLLAIIGSAVALALVLALVIVLAVQCSKEGPNNPDVPPSQAEHPETGVYYFDAGIDEYTLTLNADGSFALIVKGNSYPGLYTLTDGNLTLDFTAEGKETVTATLADNVVSLTYDGAAYRMLKKVNYTVTFEANGGSAIEAQTVLNGKTVAKPADPTREGFLFVGWYADSSFKTPFAFGAQPISDNVTVYARWSAATADAIEYTVDFDLNYENATAPEVKPTVGGKLFDLPVPTREGYTFKGWWISMDDDGSKLSYQFKDEMVFDAHTTLYALWEAPVSGSKLAAPVVNVEAGSISWNAVNGARSYAVKVVGPNGATVIDETTAGTTLNVPFANYAEGAYQITVVANANSGDADNSEAVRYYTNKALGKVSVFQVIDSMLVFNTVEHAEKYLITVACGNPDHQHTNFDNGASRTFNFANCAMTKGGIRFTVTAVAEGYASSVSKEFVYSRDLSAVSGLRYDAATQTVVWNEVADAASYMVSVTCGNSAHTHTFLNNGSQTSICLKECAALEGGIVVKVYPKTNGYNSPDAVELKVTKTTPATPSDVRINGTTLTWATVAGATKYEVQVGDQKREVTEATFDMASLMNWVEGTEYTVSVRAIGNGESLWSDALTARYNVMGNTLRYAKSVLSWDPVIGASAYELCVNDGEIITVAGGASSAKITLTRAGKNVIRVRSVDGNSRSEWVELEVFAHAVTFDTRGGSEIGVQYKAVGDLIELPVTEKVGYGFNAWYNVPGGPACNGMAYTDELFAESGALVLYAHYNPNKYTVNYNYGTDGTGDKTTDEVAYENNYQLIVPTPNEVTSVFGGWYSAPYGMGTQYTDGKGASLTPWTATEGADLYAFWIDSALQFTLTKVNGKDAYAVSAGERIALLSEVTVPASYKGLPVAMISGNAFKDCTNLKVINLPDTLEQISNISPFIGCSKLEAVNVYGTTRSSNARYWSQDGVLFDNGTGTVAQPKLLFMPLAKTGSYRIPAGITEIPAEAFANCSLSKITVPTSVTKIGREAFANSTKLTSVHFETATGESALTIGARAFSGCTMLEKIVLPARMTDIVLTKYTVSGAEVLVDDVDNAFVGCTSLSSITVVTGNKNFKSVDGVLYSADGRTLVYCPASKSGAFEIPVGTQTVAPGAFIGCNGLTEITVPNTVTLIGECAFYGLSDNLTKLTFAGNAFNDMIIDNYAFRNCKALTEVVFESGSKVATISQGAFMGCTGIENFTIPASTSKIEANAFRDCTELTNLHFAENGKTLEFGVDVFNNCTSLTRVTLPANVSKIPGVFSGCTSLESVEVADDSEYFTDIDGVIFNKAETEVLFFPQGKTDEYRLPETVTTIANGVFRNVLNLEKLIISNAITTIGDEAFRNSGIDEIVFEGGEATGELIIGAYAFENASIGTLTLPAHTKVIGNNAFANTVFTAIVLNEGLETLGDSAFAYAKGDSYVTVPASVKTIGAYCFTGEDRGSYWYHDYVRVGVVLTVENSELESIGDYAFYDNDLVEKLTVPATLKTIGNYAFYGCTGLDIVEFAPESQLETIGAYAFAFVSPYSSSDLATITLPKSLKSIGAYAFYNTALRTVEFEEGGADAPDLVLGAPYTNVTVDSYTGAVVTKEVKVGYVFANCYYLASVQLSSNVVEIGAYSFYYAGYDNSNGFTVTFGDEENPSRLTTIGANAFSSSRLKSIVIPKSVRNLDPYEDPQTGFTYDRLGIGANAFYDCYNNLESVIFETGGTDPLTIGANAFGNCKLLATVELPNRLAPYMSYTGDELAPLENGATVFYDCETLTAINVEEGGAYYVDVDGVVYTADMKEVVICPAGMTGDITIPASVTKIHDRAFFNCEQIDSVTFVGGTEPMTIGSEAFRNCAKLISIVLPTNVVSVGDYAFAAGQYDGETNALESLTLSKNLQNFSANMIDKCSKLKEILVEDGSLYYYSDNGVLYNAEKTVLISYPINREGTSYTVLPTVKTIARGAFAKNTKIEEVTLPAGLIEIEVMAFSECSALTSINVPNTVQLIGDNAFSNCTGLTNLVFEMGGTGKMVVGKYAFQYVAATDVVLPATMTIVGDYAFINSSLTNVTFEEGSKLLSLGDQVFQGTKLVAIDMPAGLEKMGDSTFFGCESLKTVTFGEGLVSIGDSTFSSCVSLESVAFPASLKTMGKETFFYDYYGDVIACDKLTSVTFGNGSQLTAIPEGTFAYTGLKSFTVPANVITIEDKDTTTRYSYGAFHNCPNLEHVTFEEGSQCKYIGAYAFYYCEALKSVNIPSSVSTLGEYTFGYCAELNNVIIPTTTTQLGAYLFYSCDSLTNVVLNTNTTVLPTYMFAYCENLTEVTIPVNVSEIGNNCFTGTKLEAFDVAEGNAFFSTVDGVLFNADKTQILVYPEYKSDAVFTVPATVTSIAYGTLNKASNLQELIFEDGESTLTIEDSAFYNMSNLVKVTLPARLVSIEDEAFRYCSGLMYINVPATMTEEAIADDAFYGCSKLYEIYNESALVLEAGSEDYGYLAAYALNIYTPTEGSSKIVEDENGFITYTETVDNATRVYLLGYTGTETVVTVPAHITDIYAEAFAGLSITKIILPDGVKTIGAYAFYECEALEEINLPTTLVEIGERAFYYCSELTNMELPEGLEIIGADAFYRCGGFEAIVLPSTLKSIGDGAFYFADVTDMSVLIPTGIITMGEEVFYGCGDMTIMVADAEPAQGWDSDWAKRDYYGNHNVLWGYTGEEITYTFETNGGTAVDAITSADSITLPAAPTRDGYYFNGWYDNADFEGSPVTDSYYNSAKNTLYAKWLTQEEFDALFAGTSFDYAIDLELATPVDVVIDEGGEKVYYKVTATTSGYYNIYLDGGDTVVRIYDENQYSKGTLYASYESGYTLIDEECYYEWEEGKTYYVVVYFYSSYTTGTLELNVTAPQ